MVVRMPWGGFVSQPGKILVQQWLPQSRKLTVDLPQDDRLIVRTFNFPGWTATVDGKPTTIASFPELGAMDIALTAGSHTVELQFLDTPARRHGNLLTLIAFLLLLAIMAIVALKTRWQHIQQPLPPPESSAIEVEVAS